MASNECFRLLVEINAGAVLIRIGFWGLLIITFVYYTPNHILSIKAAILCYRGALEYSFPNAIV